MDTQNEDSLGDKAKVGSRKESSMAEQLFTDSKVLVSILALSLLLTAFLVHKIQC